MRVHRIVICGLPGVFVVLGIQHAMRLHSIVICGLPGVFVVLGIQRAMRVHRIAICGLPGCTIFFFPTLSHKRHDFRKKKKKLLNTKCVLISSCNFCLGKKISF
jgi:hypothetical protein